MIQEIIESNNSGFHNRNSRVRGELQLQEDGKVRDRHKFLMTECENAIKEWHFADRYPKLMEALEGDDLKEKNIAALTSVVLGNQARFLDGLRSMPNGTLLASANFGPLMEASGMIREATVTQSLGDLAPRILDVVRIN